MHDIIIKINKLKAIWQYDKGLVQQWEMAKQIKGVTQVKVNTDESSSYGVLKKKFTRIILSYHIEIFDGIFQET